MLGEIFPASLLPAFQNATICLTGFTHSQTSSEATNASPRPYPVVRHPAAVRRYARLIRARFRAGAFRSCRDGGKGQAHRRADDRLRQLASPGLDEERASAGVLRPGAAPDLRLQSRGSHALLPALGRARSHASESDKAYIEALAKRFPADPKSDLRDAAEQYRDAMRNLVKRFPDDLDAATLFAEAGMNLHPWGLWRPEGAPEEGTEEIVATLESVIRREPNHLGAIHYYIHCVEASNSPERALAGANRLAELAPAAGHIVHMPAHIYIRTGDYEAALKTNQKAALADQAYIKGGTAEGMYPMMYYSHNLHFIAMAAAMNGNYLESRRGALLLAANVGPHVKEVLFSSPRRAAAMKTATVFWHFARGLALAGTGKLDEAEAEHKIVGDAQENTSPDAIFQMPINNKTKDILKIAENVLGAKISLAKNDMDATVNQLRAAVAVQDGLKYDEPQDWFYPVRESLGAVLLKIGDYAGAEEVFRADLERNPRNPRSLFGLEQALKAQDRNYDAGFVRKQFDANWKGAARPTVDDLV